jgi:hypothetical protein
MGSVFRLAFGRCSCREPQSDQLRRAICDELLARLGILRKRLSNACFQLPAYADEVQTIQGREVRFETIHEDLPDQNMLVVVRAFVHSWRRPTWVSLSGVGHMFAEGLLVKSNGQVADAPDEVMWDFR